MKVEVGLTFIIFLLNACVENLDMDVSVQKVAVVNCILSNDTVQTLSITRSVGLKDKYIYDEIENARATLYVNGSKIDTFERVAYDFRRLKYTPVAGASYRLEVEIPGETTLTATTTMPGNNYILRDSRELKYYVKYFTQYTSQNPMWICVLTEYDNGSGNILLKPGEPPSDTAVLEKDIGTDHPWVDQFNQNGSFTEYTSTPLTAPKYDYYIRIPAHSEVPVGGIYFRLEAQYGGYSTIVFRTASIEYDKYMKSSFEKMKFNEEADFTAWFDEIRVFSNIENGVGIFAAYSDQYFTRNEHHEIFN